MDHCRVARGASGGRRTGVGSGAGRQWGSNCLTLVVRVIHLHAIQHTAHEIRHTKTSIRRPFSSLYFHFLSFILCEEAVSSFQF